MKRKFLDGIALIAGAITFMVTSGLQTEGRWILTALTVGAVFMFGSVMIASCVDDDGDSGDDV